MANEITVSMRVSITNVSFVKTIDYGAISITQAVQGLQSGIVIVGTAEEVMAYGDVATLGLLTIRNLDTTNYVSYGPTSAGAMVVFGRIKAGEVAHVRLEPGIVFRWQANTANVRCAMDLFEA